MSAIDVVAAARLIRRGAVIAYPTEACFGIGCDPLNRTAVERINTLKNRPRGMGLILIADTIDKLLPFIAVDNESMFDAPVASWPGPHTWVFPANRHISPLLRAINNSVAVRVTAHRGATALCRQAQSALVSTSANRHGQKPACDARSVHRCLGASVDFVVRGSLGQQKNPTQIRDAVSGRLLRAA